MPLNYINKLGLTDKAGRRFALGVLLYVIVFASLYLALYFFGIFTKLPSSDNIVEWDAEWYHSIMLKGYEYYWFMASNSAFFPLFPFTWKLLHLGSVGISTLNFLLFLSGIYGLYRVFSIELPRLLLYMALPSGIFFFLPYSESFFFLFTSLFLIGLVRQDQKMILVALLLASLTRATAMFFLPGIIVMELFNAPTLFDRKAIRNILLYSAASLSGLLIVVLFQYMQTHEWFAFAKMQIRFWRHRFTIPGFPLVSHGGEKSIWLDALAFFSGVCATFLLLVFFIRKFFTKQQHAILNNRPFWFSATYVFMLMIYCLFFDSRCLDSQTTIDSINRYVFSTSFFFIFFIFALRYFPFRTINYVWFGLLFFVAAVLCGLGGQMVIFKGSDHMRLAGLLLFTILFIYISLHYLASHRVYGGYICFALMGLNILLSCLTLHNFISSVWAG